jgi:hypothetical protein
VAYSFNSVTGILRLLLPLSGAVGLLKGIGCVKAGFWLGFKEAVLDRGGLSDCWAFGEASTL